MSRINGFIQNVVLRNVVEIDLGIFVDFHDDDDNDDDCCLRIENTESLEVLKVTTLNGLKMPAFLGCFPLLRTFDVKVSLYESGDDLITNLIPCLSGLEKLSFVGDLNDCTGEIYVNIGGKALKSLELELRIDNIDDCDAMPAISEVSIDVGEFDEEFLEFLEEVGPTRCSRVIELLHGMVNAKFISVSANTSKVIFSQKWNCAVASLTKWN
ncbi:hypothetical protein Tco_0688985 [Tanacetum coccineum]